jgi:hypothetical protein
MKKLIYGGLILGLLGTGIFSCEKKEVRESDGISASVNDSQYDENGTVVNKDCDQCWALATLLITIITPDAFHRGTESRKRDGVSCSCSACFGMCWDNNSAPHNTGNLPGVGSVAFSEIVDGHTTIYFLDGLPSNFETEFGIDDYLNVYLEDDTFITLEPGEYSAQESMGVINPDDENLQVYGSVKVAVVQ